MIRIFILRRDISLQFTNPLVEEYLNKNGISYTRNPLAADVLASISSRFRSYRLVSKLFFFKKFIVWANEPRLDHNTENFSERNRVMMNVYSGNVFLHNLHFLGAYHDDFSNALGIDLQSPPGTPLTVQKLGAKQKFCAAFIGYRDPQNSQLFCGGRDIDLFVRRQNLALFLYERRKADIIGNDWPASVATLESSRYESGNTTWWDRKLALLQDYKFNICFENTAYPHYCTEKIWHAIAAGCLPIYYGAGTAIYETFPENSFVDAAQFETHEDLLSFLENISPAEHIARYNTCLEVMHRACTQRLESAHADSIILEQFVSNVRQLVGN